MLHYLGTHSPSNAGCSTADGIYKETQRAILCPMQYNQTVYTHIIQCSRIKLLDIYLNSAGSYDQFNKLRF